jgi:hypothetical protein
MPDLFVTLKERDDGNEIVVPERTEHDSLAILKSGEITASKLVPWGSNYTFAVGLETPDGQDMLAIYKPRSGESPLYDFPDGTLFKREVASYLLSKRLGWNLVPPTVIRSGPHGVGSLQLYIEPEPDGPELRHFWGQNHPEVERLILFDHITNNADRKIGHCLRDAKGKVWGIDHGLTFNHVPKLRTVLWQMVGEPISPALLADLSRICMESDEIRAEFARLLSRAEIDALFARIERFLMERRYPPLNPRRNIPYGWW